MNDFLKTYNILLYKRNEQDLPVLALDDKQTKQLIAELTNYQPSADDEVNPEYLQLLEILENDIPPGVYAASAIKAKFLYQIAAGELQTTILQLTPAYATHLLGTMQGGYNVGYLIKLLDNPQVASLATTALGNTILVYDAFNKIVDKAVDNQWAQQVLQNWADANWFYQAEPMPEKITVTFYKVEGEVNTDDLSPAADAWSRPDIPLHSLSMLKNRAPNAVAELRELEQSETQVAFSADVLGTGSSRKSAINSLLWFIGKKSQYIPAKKSGGVIIAGTIAPIFMNTAQDAGVLAIECDLSKLAHNSKIDIYPYAGRITEHNKQQTLCEFPAKPSSELNTIRAGGRINYIIGKQLTQEARAKLNLDELEDFHEEQQQQVTGNYTLAQKIVGKACNKAGVSPDEYCEPHVSTVGSQDTTGAMTRDELRELACLNFNCNLFLQSFCHTAAYPKPVDLKLHQELPDFVQQLGGVSLRPGDGVIHPWLNHCLLPDTVGTGGDSHTRFPLGISFPAGSGLIAFAAAMGFMPLTMPESVLVEFYGELQQGITLRDLVNAIPYAAIQQNLLTVDANNKKNIFSGRIIEISGLEQLTAKQAFELSDSSAERSASGCCINLSLESTTEYIEDNKRVLQQLVDDNYQDQQTLKKRIQAMDEWLQSPQLLRADENAIYSQKIKIDMNTITQPIVACPNNPDDVKQLEQVAGTKIDEVFIGSCMTNIEHYQTVAKILAKHNIKEGDLKAKVWFAPATKIDLKILEESGDLQIFKQAGVQLEIPGCSLCMGNQARVEDKATVFSTSTRNFPNRMGKDTEVFLGSAELAIVCAILGEIPDCDGYLKYL